MLFAKGRRRRLLPIATAGVTAFKEGHHVVSCSVPLLVLPVCCPQAERREEGRRRGNKDTQTSDARFDEQFTFAHKLHGTQAMPWCAGGRAGERGTNCCSAC